MNAAPPVVDLRSDTVTKPTAGMRRAMAEAEVGDDVYGEDPTVNRLEQQVAALLGHEAGLFTPTGSMANQLGVRLVAPVGAELLCDALAHVVRAELGAHAALTGVTTRTWSSVRGRLDAEQVLALVERSSSPYFVSTAAVAVEDTHNFGGGTIQPVEEVRALRKATRDLEVAMHLDGARLWNSHVATGVGLAELAGDFDTVSVCLSKGLGAPIGSVLVSSAARIAEARIWRKRLGGGMRQVGVLAAAGIYALEHHVDRLADDHTRARRLAEVCAEAAPGSVDPDEVETNIVAVRVGDPARVVAACAERGVLVGPLGAGAIRFVTHLDVDDEAADRTAPVLAAALRA
jgi:threonine aldolase